MMSNAMKSYNLLIQKILILTMDYRMEGLKNV